MARMTARLIPQLADDRQLWLACGGAALFHLALLFGLRFGLEPDVPASLEVTLAAIPGSEAPLSARVLAPVAQAGGGTQRELRARQPRAGGPLDLAGLSNAADPATRPAAPAAGHVQTITASSAAERILSDGETAQTGGDPALLLQRREQAGNTATSLEQYPTTQAASEDRARGAPALTTRAAREAAYRELWRQRVERAGSANFPWSALTTGQPKSLTLHVTMRADGRVAQSRVLRSSGLPMLDQAALDILRMAGPFPSFPDPLRRETSELSFVYVWEFLPGDRAALRVGN
jgi:protein TonB